MAINTYVTKTSRSKAYMITEILSRKEKVKSVVEILCSSNGFAWAMWVSFSIRSEPCATRNRTSLLEWTYNPIFDPTASMNPQACWRCFSSWLTDSFPRCRSDIRSTSSGVKYGRWYLTWEAGSCEGESRSVRWCWWWWLGSMFVQGRVPALRRQ